MEKSCWCQPGNKLLERLMHGKLNGWHSQNMEAKDQWWPPFQWDDFCLPPEKVSGCHGQQKEFLGLGKFDLFETSRHGSKREAIEGTESLKILEQTSARSNWRHKLGTVWGIWNCSIPLCIQIIFEPFLYPPHSGEASLLENEVGLWSSKMCGASSGICLIGVRGRGLVLSDESMMSTGMFEHHWGWGSKIFFSGQFAKMFLGFTQQVVYCGFFVSSF